MMEKILLNIKIQAMKKVSIQSSKYENWFFYVIYNTNFHLVNSLCINLDKQEDLAYLFQI